MRLLRSLVRVAGRGLSAAGRYLRPRGVGAVALIGLALIGWGVAGYSANLAKIVIGAILLADAVGYAIRRAKR